MGDVCSLEHVGPKTTRSSRRRDEAQERQKNKEELVKFRERIGNAERNATCTASQTLQPHRGDLTPMPSSTTVPWFMYLGTPDKQALAIVDKSFNSTYSRKGLGAILDAYHNWMCKPAGPISLPIASEKEPNG
eukprot:6705577-Pyramimonas_sp.AAC.1